MQEALKPELIEDVEESVKEWMFRVHQRKIGVSVQLRYSAQGTGREQPDNEQCQAAYDDNATRRVCDLSDNVMKEIVAAAGNTLSIGYCCHQDLSNIVIPHFDVAVTKVWWYIFLGRFALRPLGKCPNCQARDASYCRAYDKLLKANHIQPLNSKHITHIPESDRSSVKTGVYCGGLPELPTEFTLNIVHVLACKAQALTILGDALRTASGSEQDALKKYTRDYGTHARRTRTDKKGAGQGQTSKREPQKAPLPKSS